MEVGKFAPAFGVYLVQEVRIEGVTCGGRRCGAELRGVDDKFDGAILDELRWQDNLLQSAICLRGMEYKRGRGKRKKSVPQTERSVCGTPVYLP